MRRNLFFLLLVLALFLAGQTAAGAAAGAHLWIVADGQLHRVDTTRLSSEPIGNEPLAGVTSMAAVGRTLYATQQAQGNNTLYRVDTSDGSLEHLWTFDAGGKASTETFMTTDGKDLYIIQQARLYCLPKALLEALPAEDGKLEVPGLELRDNDGAPALSPIGEPWFAAVTAMAINEHSVHMIQNGSFFRVNVKTGKRRRRLNYTLGDATTLSPVGENFCVLRGGQLFEVSRADGAERNLRQDRRWQDPVSMVSYRDRLYICTADSLLILDPETAATRVEKKGRWRNVRALAMTQ